MIDNRIPLAQVPIYITEQPNQTIHLYSGPMELHQANIVEQGQANVAFVWLPYPRVRFEFNNDNISARLKLDDPRVLPTVMKLPALGISVGTSIRSISPDHQTKQLRIIGQPLDDLIIGPGNNLASVVFHLPNFHQYQGYGIRSTGKVWGGRIKFEAAGWVVTIDSIDSDQSIEKSLETVGGYGITHVGRLERSDQSAFDADAASDVLDCLFYLFSFARGFWLPPLLHVGFDNNENKVWERWCDWKSSPWQHVDSWFPEQGHNCLAAMFPGFIKKYQDPVWGDTCRLVIDWYVQSNTSITEQSLVLSQTALELLAWVTLVEEGGNLGEDGFKKIRASDKLRLLLSQTAVSLAIPTSQNNLKDLLKNEKWQDGPQAITEIRNRLVHPKVTRQPITNPPKKTSPIKPKNALGYPMSARYEAMQLGLWYIEQVLMHIFSYKGPYDSNRLEKYVIS